MKPFDKELIQLLQNLVQRVAALEGSVKANPPEDQRVEKIASRLAAKLATLEKGNDGHTPTEDELLKLIKPLIPILKQPADGKTPTKEELLALIRPLIPQVRDGRTPTKDELIALIVPLIPKAIEPIVPTVDEIEAKVEARLPALGTAVRDGLELLQGDERLDQSAIKGLVDKLNELDARPTGTGSGGAAKTRITAYDVSSQCNGVNKTFTIPFHFGVIGVYSTQAPIIYRPIIDYTVGGRSITLTSQVDAPQSGQSLIIQFVR